MIDVAAIVSVPILEYNHRPSHTTLKYAPVEPELPCIRIFFMLRILLDPAGLENVSVVTIPPLLLIVFGKRLP